MVDIIKEIDIEAPPKKVLDFITVSTNHPKFLLPIYNVRGPQGPLTKIGQEWSWDFCLGGITVPGKCEVSEYIESKKYAYKIHGEFEGSFTYTVRPIKKGTHLRVKVSYSLPETLIKRIASTLFIKHINEKVAEQAIINLEAILSESAYRDSMVQ